MDHKKIKLSQKEDLGEFKLSLSSQELFSTMIELVINSKINSRYEGRYIRMKRLTQL